MAIVNTLKVYENLKEKLPEAQAKVITEVIEKSFEEYRENQKEFLAIKEDLTNLKAELIKWMFIFWVGQIGVITAILFTFLNK